VLNKDMTNKMLLGFILIYFSAVISGVLSLTFAAPVSADIPHIIIHSIPLISIISLVILVFYTAVIKLLIKPLKG
jgi:hypothetical protein